MEFLINGLAVFFHALKYKATGSRVPLMVSLGLTRKCNLRCPFCYAMEKPDAAADVTTEELFGYIDQFIALGTRLFLLQGGEPLLRRDLKEIIAYIKKKRRFCRISTNGTLVASRIDALEGIDQISFSLDGNEAVADKIRGAGVYRKVVEGMEAAFSRGIPFEIHASLVRESIADKESLFHLLELARKFRTHVSFCVACVSGSENTREIGSADLSAEEIREFYRFLARLKREKYPVSNTFNSLNKTLRWPISYSQIGYPDNLPAGFDHVQCRHGRLVCWVDKDTMYPCPAAFHRPEYATPIEKGDIKKAWDALGGKVHCVACSGSDESTGLLALQYEDVKETFLRVARDLGKGKNR